MTAGQGGPQDGGGQGGVPGQGGPPQGWNAPPPGWNAPPPGWNAPPGGYQPQQPYGYAPAPPPQYGPPPTPLERPVTVRAGLGCIIGSIVLSLISAVVTYLNWDTITEQMLARMNTQLGSGAEVAATRSAVQSLATVVIVVGLVFAAVYGLFVWFAWSGQNWARIVLWVLAGLGLAGDLIGLAAGGSPLPFLTGLSFFQVFLLLAAIVLLARKPSNDWFRYRRWLRATGQAR